MICPIMTKQFFLKQPSVEANAGDAAIARDLADTLEAHRATCVGMAANMICEREFEDRVAQAVQHEIDRCDGVLI